MEKLKILFMAANPTDQTDLRLGQEWRDVRERIHLAEHWDRVEMTSRWAVRTDEVIQALLEEKPHIVHFSGHGGTSALVLEDAQGQSKTVSPEALLAVFQAIPDRLRLAVFNTCDSLPLAKTSVIALDAAIGMNRPVSDTAAISFAASIYQAIAFGRTLQEAFNLGIAALRMEGIREDSTPKLVMKAGLDAATVRLLAEIPVKAEFAASSSALAIWREKLALLQQAEAIATDPSEKFRLSKQIEEAHRKIQELGEDR